MASKKLGKLLAFTAIAGAAVAAGIAYFKHKNNSEFFDEDFDDLDDDFDDEDFDFPLSTNEEDSSVKREYVSINLDKDSTDSQTQEEVKQEESNEEAVALQTEDEVK